MISYFIGAAIGAVPAFWVGWHLGNRSFKRSMRSIKLNLYGLIKRDVQ
jgi:membrane protein DedA with SNARE-associated domain